MFLLGAGHSRINPSRGMLSSRWRLRIAESSFPRKLRLSVGQCSGEHGDMIRPKLALDDYEPGLTLCNSWQLVEYVSSENAQNSA